MVNYKYRTKPYNHQIQAFNKLYGKEYFALFMEQGTGKTKTLIDIASNLYLEGKISGVLLFAPNRVHKQWVKEQLPEHSPIDYDVFLWENNKSKAVLYELNNFIKPSEPNEPLKWFCVNIETMSTGTNIEIFKKFLINNRSLLCIDEATRIKSPSAARTINIIQGLAELTKLRDTIITYTPYSAYRAILTGMMVTNAPHDIWSMYEFLKHNFFGRTFYSFKQRYSLVRNATVSGTDTRYDRTITLREINQIRALLNQGMHITVIAKTYGLNISDIIFIKENPELKVPYKNLPELKALIQDTSYIVRKADCLDLPDQIYTKVYVRLNKDQIKIYNDLIDEHYAEYADKELSVVNKLTLTLRLQQITGGFFPAEKIGTLIGKSNPKIDAVLDELEETADFPVLIFARFKNEINYCYETIKNKRQDLVVERITGDLSAKHNDTVLEDFKAGKIDVLVSITNMISLGQNLQICHTTFYLSNDFSLETRIQSEDRTHRSGQEHKVLYKDFLVEDSVDEGVYKVLHEKNDLLEYMQSKSVYEFVGGKYE